MSGIASIEIILFLPCSSFLLDKILPKLWNVIGILWASRSLKVFMYPFIRSIMETLFTFDMISWLKYYVFNIEFTWTVEHEITVEIYIRNIRNLATSFSHAVLVINSSADIQSSGHERKGWRLQIWEVRGAQNLDVREARNLDVQSGRWAQIRGAQWHNRDSKS